jgi:hypothetical protein
MLDRLARQRLYPAVTSAVKRKIGALEKIYKLMTGVAKDELAQEVFILKVSEI